MGILDTGFDPRTQGLLAAAFQGLQASGPSRMPMSLGQIIGQAGSAGMGQFNSAQKAAQEQARQQQLMEMERQRIEQQRVEFEQKRKQQEAINAFQQKFASGAFTQSPAEQALAGGGGPTPENASLIPKLSPKLDRGAMYQEMIGTPGLLTPGVTGLASMEENEAKREEARTMLQLKINEAREARDQKSVDALERLKMQLDSKQSLAEMMMAGRKDITNLAGSLRQPRNLQLTTDAAGNQLIVNSDGTTRPLTTEDGTGVKKTVGADKPMTEFQGKAALYGTRAAQSDKVLKALEDKISTTGLSAAQSLGTVGNFMMSSEQKRVSQAQRDFVNAVLRQESGAVISDAEFANAKQQYFPAPGDDKKTIEQKRANRQIAVQGFARMSGPKGAVDINAVLENPLLPGVRSNPETPQASGGVIGGASVLEQADAILKGKR